MTMRTAGDWIDDAPHGDNPADWFRWVRAIQRDALESASEACAEVAQKHQKISPQKYTGLCVDCAIAIERMMPEEPKP